MEILTKISVVSCVNDLQKYNSCVGNSFQQEQEDGIVELIAIDNTANQLSIPQALNEGFKKANSEVIVFCHQDVKFPKNWIEQLFAQISLVEVINRKWGVLGTFGVAQNGMLAGHLIDYCGHFHCLPLPAEVQSLDEHCLIMRKDRCLVFDEELGGFHLYGADICLQAMSKGSTNYAIDACVEHMSPGGNVDDNFEEIMNKLYLKWRYKNPPLSVIETTCRLCRLQAGLTGWLAYATAKYKNKHRRKKIKVLLKKGLDFRTLRHDIA